MAWHIKKTSLLGSAAVGTVYYKGDKCWTETLLIERLIPHKRKRRKKILSGRRKLLLDGM